MLPPINTDEHIETVEVISAAELVKSWRSDFGIDTSHLFTGVDKIQMVRDCRTGIVFFYPPILGDADFYDSLRKFKWYHPPTKEEYAFAANWLKAGHSVIDVGAGHGGFADHVPRDQYIGLETDPSAAADCQKRGLRVLNVDMATYRKMPDVESADLVTAFQVLEHVSEPDIFLDKMVSLAKTGGRIAIGVPDADSYVRDLPDFMLNAPPHHVTWWTEASLRSLMDRHNAKIVAIERFQVEPWEKQLWWMAKLAKIWRPNDAPCFGSRMRVRKVISFLISYILQVVPPPKSAQGSTILIIAQKT